MSASDLPQYIKCLACITFTPVCKILCLQETDSLSLEMFEILENRKEMMLDIAVKCFTTASKVSSHVTLYVFG